MNGFIEVTNEHTRRRMLISVDEVAMMGRCSDRDASFISLRSSREDVTVSDPYESIVAKIAAAKGGAK